MVASRVALPPLSTGTAQSGGDSVITAAFTLVGNAADASDFVPVATCVAAGDSAFADSSAFAAACASDPVISAIALRVGRLSVSSLVGG